MDRTKCLKDKYRSIKNYGALHSLKGKFGSEEFLHYVGSTNVS